MRLLAHSLFLNLVLSLVAQAEIPVFVAKEPLSYLGNTDNAAAADPDGINLDDSAGLRITFGTEISRRIIDASIASCGDTNSDECTKAIHDTMGIGPTANGLQKRLAILPILGVGVLAYLIPKIWSGIFSLIDPPVEWQVVEFSLDNEDMKAVNSMDLDVEEPQFEYKPPTGDSSIIIIDDNQPKPEILPTITKMEDGSLAVSMVDIVPAIKEAWGQVLCSRARKGKRSFEKRITMACLVERAQAIMRLAQLGGPGVGIQYISPADFPKPKNELLVGMMEEDQDYAEELLFGGGLAAEARGDISTFSSWLAFGYEVGHLDFDSSGTMVFPADFLESQEESSEGCWEDNHMPFCTTCGGNDKVETAGSNTGICKGVGEGDQAVTGKGCKCHVDYFSETQGPTPDELQMAFDYLHNLPDLDEGESDDEPDYEFKKTCWKQDEDRMKDRHNWKFVQQTKLDEAIKDWCDNMTPLTGPEGAVEQYKEYYSEDGNWDRVILRLHQQAAGSASKEDCHKWLMDISAGCDFDSGELEHNRNQYNWKWGGQVETESGAIWSIEPQLERVLFEQPVYKNEGLIPTDHLCYTLQGGSFEEHDNIGLNGDPLDDTAKKTLIQCAHMLPLLGEDQDVSCGGYLNMGFHRKSYDSSHDCGVNTLDCLRYWVDQGKTARGNHKPGFSDCWADFMF